MHPVRLGVDLCLALCLSVGVTAAAPQKQLVILDARVVGNVLTVNGLNFGSEAPLVLLGGTIVLEVIEATPTSLEATSDELVWLLPGSYLLTVLRNEGPPTGQGSSKLALGTFDLAIGAVTVGENQAIVFDAPGGVGIGVDAPEQLLHVGGSAKVDDTLFVSTISGISPLTHETDGVTRIFFSDSTNDGNIWIGTITPTEPLEVAGNILSTGTVTAGAFVGDGSGLTGLARAVGPTGPAGPTGPSGAPGLVGPQGASPWGLNLSDTFHTDGRVGVGTVTPLGTLQASGSMPRGSRSARRSGGRRRLVRLGPS